MSGCYALFKLPTWENVRAKFPSCMLATPVYHILSLPSQCVPVHFSSNIDGGYHAGSVTVTFNLFPPNRMFCKCIYFLIFKYILLSMLLQLSHIFLPCIPLCPVPPPLSFPHLSSCLWVMHISSLASPFPIVFITSPCLFGIYHLCFLVPVSISSFSPLPLNDL